MFTNFKVYINTYEKIDLQLLEFLIDVWNKI